MTGKDKIDYWIATAESDWTVAGHLFEKGDYSYALFFGHLTLEKLLKALYVSRTDKTPPMTHRLVYLAEKSGLDLTDDRLELLETATDFNIEARYPDEKFSFRRRCTKEFTKDCLDRMEEARKWPLRKISSSRTSEDTSTS